MAGLSGMGVRRCAGAALAVILGMATTGVAMADPLPDTPEATVRYLFGKATPEEAKALTAGEFGSLVARGGSPAGGKLTFETLSVVQKDDKAAVLSSDLPAESGQGPTGYVFLINQDNQWKVEALRTLGIPANIGQLIDGWDKASESERTARFADKPADARPAFELLLAGIKLARQPDRDAVAFFKENRAQFDSLRDRVKAGGLTGRTSVEDMEAGRFPDWRTPPASDDARALIKDFRSVRLSGGAAASFGSEMAAPAVCGKDCASFIVYSLGSKTFGYMWLGPNGSLPRLSPQGFLMTAALGDGWYMYKTE